MFAGLLPEDLADICQTARRCQARRGTLFCHQDEPASLVYVLMVGKVKLTRLKPDGREVIIRFIEPGELFGGTALVGDAVYTFSAEATEDSEALAWNSDTLLEHVRRYPSLAVNALRLMAERVEELRSRLAALATERVEQRLARMLLQLAERACPGAHEGGIVELNLSRRDLAELIGTTIYTASRILSRWDRQGLVDARRRRVRIRDPQELTRLAEPSA